MNKNTITITTDFGDSFATAQLHAVMASLGFTGHIIENHSVAPYAIHSGAFEIKTLSQFCSEGTVHLGVIDPGVGSARAGVVIKTKNFWFVGPDNGLLYPAANFDEITHVWKINEEAFGQVTNTFHGRDVFIKAAVYLTQSKNPEEFGCTLIDQSDLIKLTFKEGQVLHIDAYGNIKVYTTKKFEVGHRLTIKNGKYELKIPLVRTFDDASVGQPLAYEGSSHTLEFAVNQGNFAEAYNISNNEVFHISQT